VLTVEHILLSVISMLADPNLESPANVDAAIMFKNDRPAYDKKLKQLAKKSM
jgi:ubiquitin-protein ligase